MACPSVSAVALVMPAYFADPATSSKPAGANFNMSVIVERSAPEPANVGISSSWTSRRLHRDWIVKLHLPRDPPCPLAEWR